METAKYWHPRPHRADGSRFIALSGVAKTQGMREFMRINDRPRPSLPTAGAPGRRGMSVKWLSRRGLLHRLSREIFICPLFGILFFHSQNLSAEDAATLKLVDLLSGLSSYSASFQQRVTEEDGYVLDENRGIMSFAKPNKLFWKVQEPFPNLLISDGERVYFYDPELNQVTVRNWSSDPSENPVAVFIGGAEIRDYYGVTEVGGAFVLIPLNPGSGFAEIRLEFNKKVPSAMLIVDKLGQLTKIVFSPLGKGSIPGSPYVFDIPASAEIINEE